MIAVYIIILIVLLINAFWLLCLIVAQIAGSPTVYSNKKAIVDCLKLAGLKKGETVVDLGCGNARSLIIAANQFGAKGVGVERSPFCVIHSRLAVWLSGNSKNIKILSGDFKKAEKYLADADVVYLYLLNTTLRKLETWYFKSIGDKTRTVSLAFSFGKHEPKKIIDTYTLGHDTKARLY